MQYNNIWSPDTFDTFDFSKLFSMCCVYVARNNLVLLPLMSSIYDDSL